MGTTGPLLTQLPADGEELWWLGRGRGHHAPWPLWEPHWLKALTDLPERVILQNQRELHRNRAANLIPMAMGYGPPGSDQEDSGAAGEKQSSPLKFGRPRRGSGCLRF